MKQTQWIIVVFLVLSFFAKVVFVPILLALFLSMLLDPVVKFAMRLKLSRSLASTAVVGLFAVSAAAMGWFCYSALVQIVMILPTYVEKLNLGLFKVAEVASKVAPNLHLETKVPEVLLSSQTYSEFSHFALNSISTIFEVISLLFFVPLMMFYFLVDKENLLESFNVLNGKNFNLPKLNTDLPKILRVFFAANIITGAFLALTQAIVFFHAGYQNWMSLALVTAGLNLVPIVGAGLAVVTPLLFGLGVTLTFPIIMILLVAIVGLHFVANNLIVPLLVGSRLNVNAVTLIIGLLFWSWNWGVAGFLLAVPMTAMFKLFLECSRETQGLANLMASRPTRILERRTTSQASKLAIRWDENRV